MLNTIKKAVFFVLFSFFSINLAHAQQSINVTEAYRWKAKIEEVKTTSAQGIPFLSWNKDTILIESTGFLHYTDLQGVFSEKVIRATLNSKVFPVREDGSFNIHFGFPSEAKTFVIIATDTKDNIYRVQYKISPINYQELTLEKVPPHRWRFSAGAGLTQLSFRQKNVVPFGQFAFTVKGSATYKITPEKLDLGFSTFFNALPFGSNSIAGYKIQYIGLNTRLVWNLLGSPSPLRINLSGGLYYNTSLSTIGFTNMYGPQLYPEFIYVFDNGNSLLFYGKYSPAFSQSSSLSFKDNREIAAGTHYSFPISFTNRLSVGMDISQLNMSIVKGDWASTNTYSLSAGISF